MLALMSAADLRPQPAKPLLPPAQSSGVPLLFLSGNKIRDVPWLASLLQPEVYRQSGLWNGGEGHLPNPQAVNTGRESCDFRVHGETWKLGKTTVTVYLGWTPPTKHTEQEQ